MIETSAMKEINVCDISPVKKLKFSVSAPNECLMKLKEFSRE